MISATMSKLKTGRNEPQVGLWLWIWLKYNTRYHAEHSPLSIEATQELSSLTRNISLIMDRGHACSSGSGERCLTTPLPNTSSYWASRVWGFQAGTLEAASPCPGGDPCSLNNLRENHQLITDQDTEGSMELSPCLKIAFPHRLPYIWARADRSRRNPPSTLEWAPPSKYQITSTSLLH